MAVLGLGEAGSAIAADLVGQGVKVRGYDPIEQLSVQGIERVHSELEAARGADIILSVNWARVALEVAETVAPRLQPGQLFADFNTASPALKKSVAAVLEPTGALFADVALMSPVPGNGVRTPALVSGPGASAFAQRFAALEMPVTEVGPEVGTAAARKLVRSVFFKGLSAAVGEALGAARRLGFEAEAHQNIAETLEGASACTVDRLVEGNLRHAKRRREEMAAAAAMLREIGLEPHVAAASEAWLADLTRQV
jgi:3-hydroxyisobutyrate dehydrogenase-like beta-hydroxyacid dehydrogenase